MPAARGAAACPGGQPACGRAETDPGLRATL